ncbi:MAG: hypothetical protein COV36_06620 [Alphaproteobacteria bacterium CG11_big_fil_rev_8_21_14_0_20_44_7]|nr:MAG: hypothetical protein COV36_06620 [Alphaproteobacteria bacterium CG11_big_fil_rev_8_21_14_0_20_44_7]
MKDDIIKELADILQGAALINYKIGPGSILFETFSTAFADIPQVSEIVEKSRRSDSSGIVVFAACEQAGYGVQAQQIRMINELIPVLDNAGVPYGNVELEDGRQVYFISHADARDILPTHQEIGTMISGKGSLDKSLQNALDKMIADKESAVESSAEISDGFESFVEKLSQRSNPPNADFSRLL